MFYIMLKSAATHFTSLFAQITVINNKPRQTYDVLHEGSCGGRFPEALPWTRGSGTSIGLWNSA